MPCAWTSTELLPSSVGLHSLEQTAMLRVLLCSLLPLDFGGPHLLEAL